MGNFRGGECFRLFATFKEVRENAAQAFLEFAHAFYSQMPHNAHRMSGYPSPLRVYSRFSSHGFSPFGHHFHPFMFGPNTGKYWGGRCRYFGSFQSPRRRHRRLRFRTRSRLNYWRPNPISSTKVKPHNGIARASWTTVERTDKDCSKNANPKTGMSLGLEYARRMNSGPATTQGLFQQLIRGISYAYSLTIIPKRYITESISISAERFSFENRSSSDVEIATAATSVSPIISPITYTKETENGSIEVPVHTDTEALFNREQSDYSYVDFDLTPRFSIPTTSDLTDDIVRSLEADLARYAHDVECIITELRRVASLGELPISIERQGSVLRIHFPNSDAERVKCLLEDIEVSRGIVGSQYSDGSASSEQSASTPASSWSYSSDIRDLSSFGSSLELDNPPALTSASLSESLISEEPLLICES